MPIVIEAGATTTSARREVAASLIGLLDDAGVPTYLLSDLATLDALPKNYAELHLSTRGRGNPRSTGESAVGGWRAQVRVVGSTVRNAYLLLDLAAEALTGARVVVPEGKSTPLVEQPSDPPDADDGYYSALAEWTFTI